MIADENFKVENDDYTDVRISVCESKYLDDACNMICFGSFLLNLDVLIGSVWHNVYFAFSDDTADFVRLSKLYKKICSHLYEKYKKSEVVHNG